MPEGILYRFYQRCKHQFVFPHLLFWFVSLLFFLLLLFYTRGVKLAHIDLRTATSILITLVYLAISVYINLLWLIPRFFKKRRFFLFSLLQVANIILFILLNYFTSHAFEEEHPEFISEAIAEAILVTIFLIVTTLLKFMRDSIALQDAELKVKEIESQKVRAELQALKSQVNPHFFFNTLNSLYALSLDKSDKVPDMILKLSDLMRYVIYESQDTQVPLNKQLEFLKSYVFLEKMRADEHLEVKFLVVGENLHMRIDPLIFIAFIENAFKHGSKAKSSTPYIYIEFHVEQPDTIWFSVENNIDLPDDHVDPSKNGFGLDNVKKRLDLLYPKCHSLELVKTETAYRVNLSISIDCV
ncbi:MAG: sensor histidine kinase [Bacteroidales bacterium]|nr:sensor histidine kinase [Bacteroidales bacterium]